MENGFKLELVEVLLVVLLEGVGVGVVLVLKLKRWFFLGCLWVLM